MDRNSPEIHANEKKFVNAEEEYSSANASSNNLL